MIKKICNKCKDEKEIDEFPFRNKEKNIRHNTCKGCWKEIRKISYNKNKKTTLDRNKRNKEKNKIWYDDFKTNLKCNRCPENHPACLEFHHIDPEEKEFTISELIGTTYSINKIKKEIEKCEVLCANCHRKHHYNEKIMKEKLEFNIEETRNLDECMNWVKSHMCSSEEGDENFKKWLLESEDDAMMIHHGYGTFIRNTLQLWHDGPAVTWFNEKGIFHADDMSGIIFTSLHRRENNLEIKLDEQISKYRKHWEKHCPEVNEGKLK